MPTVFAHPLIAVAAWPWVRVPRLPRSVLVVGAMCTIVPDLDVVGLRLGVPYESLLGHRGLSHSLPFAAALAGLLMLALKHLYHDLPSCRALLFLFVCTASHGVLDAFTSGGHGVAFFAPFSNERYFFPWQPIEVSPLSIERFLTERGIRVLWSELRWVGAPLAVFAVVGLVVRRSDPGRHRAVNAHKR